MQAKLDLQFNIVLINVDLCYVYCYSRFTELRSESCGLNRDMIHIALNGAEIVNNTDIFTHACTFGVNKLLL